MATINWNPDRLGREEYEAARQAKFDHLDATYGAGRWSASMHLDYWDLALPWDQLPPECKPSD